VQLKFVLRLLLVVMFAMTTIVVVVVSGDVLAFRCTLKICFIFSDNGDG